MRVSVLMAPAVLASLLSATPAAAQKSSSSNDLSIGIRFGTLGVGPEVAKLLTPHIGLRAGVNFFSYSATKTSSDITYDGKLKMQGFNGLLDLFLSPRGSFHFTGGVITSPAKLTATGVPTSSSTFTINHQTYTAAQVGTLSAVGEWPSASPYVGLGWGTPASKHHGISFKLDLGAAIGKPTMTLSRSSGTANAQLDSDIAAQQDTLQTKINKVLKVYPVVQFGLVFHF